MSYQQQQMASTVSSSTQFIDDEFDPSIYQEAPTANIGSQTNKATGYQIWNNTGKTGFRPVIYKPNGSFASLKASGKLAGLNTDYVRPAEPDHCIPGYTGYIRGSQHIQGRTYGETTRRTKERDYRELACTSPIPSDPHHSRKIPVNNNTNTFVGSKNLDSRCHIPGYTGVVRHSRDSFGVTFGTLSRSQLKDDTPTQTNIAEPLFKRQVHTLDSAPLPGGIQSHQPPQKLIPAHLTHVKYLAY